MGNKKKTLRMKAYEAACMDYIDAFCKKQNLEFDGWVGDEIGQVAGFSSQYYFNLSDIIYDIDTEQLKGNILSWQDESINFNSQLSKPKIINYKSYCIGLRYEDLGI